MQKYRIVLTPKNQLDIDKFYSITKSADLIVDNYHMKKTISIPHITINDIILEDDTLENAFKKIENIIKPNITFEGLTIASKKQGKFVHLLVKTDKITEYYKEVSKVLNLEYNINLFLPHVSLFSTNEMNDKVIVDVIGDYSFIFKNEIEYKLAIGSVDEVGQVEKLLISLD